MSRIVAQRVTDGMVLSTANLYFTAHDNGGAGVFRTAQSATPGQEVELCHEPDCRFGDIVWAKVDEVFYGYFFAPCRRHDDDQTDSTCPAAGPGCRDHHTCDRRHRHRVEPWQPGHRRLVSVLAERHRDQQNVCPGRGGRI